MTAVHYGGAVPQVDRPHTVASSMTTRPDKFHPSYHYVLTHELAHVYTLSNRVTEAPAALAAAHLYFSELSEGVCLSYELLANTAEHLGFYSTSNNYWGACPHLPHVATSEAITVVREAFQGQMPGWFYDTFQGTGGDLDYDAIWEAIRGVTDRQSRRVVVYQLRNSFGGYCSSHEVNEFLNGEGNLDAGQPWVDGGCEESEVANEHQVPVGQESADTTATVRIVARKLGDSRIEFGLQQRDPDGWGDRRLPRMRFFPTTAGVDRWLTSSTLTLTTP